MRWLPVRKKMRWDLAECGWDLAECGWDLAKWLECLTVNAVVAIVLGSIPASADTVESEGRQMKQRWISYIKRKKKSPFTKKLPRNVDVVIKHLNISQGWVIGTPPPPLKKTPPCTQNSQLIRLPPTSRGWVWISLFGRPKMAPQEPAHLNM